MQYSPDQQIQQLVAKCLNGSITADEQVQLDEWYSHLPDESTVWPAEMSEEETRVRIFTAIIGSQSGKTRFLYPKVIQMAAALLVFIIGFWAYRSFDDEAVREVAVTNTRQQHDYTSGNRREVILNLADGSKMVLNKPGQSGMFKHGATTIKESGNSAYIYSSASGIQQAANVFNSILTPAGMKFNIVLADGTKVWLNALSALKFPASFGSGKRVVELAGEAYFEVAKDSEHPFVVNLVNGTSVNVLGTHFNVTAYDDEDAVATTLLEGSVRINHKGVDQVIVPGQQATVKQGIKVTNVDAQQAVAWKNDLFCFDSADTREVMRQIGRWYGIKIIYSSAVNRHQLAGYVSRNAKLADVLKMLELSGMNFLVKENEIEVLN